MGIAPMQDEIDPQMRIAPFLQSIQRPDRFPVSIPGDPIDLLRAPVQGNKQARHSGFHKGSQPLRGCQSAGKRNTGFHAFLRAGTD